MRFFLELFTEHSSIVAISFAVLIFLATVILYYGFGLWWPWGFAASLGLGMIGFLTSNSE